MMTATLGDVARKKVEASAEQEAAVELVRLAKEKGLFNPTNPYAAFGLQAAPTKTQATKIIDHLKASPTRPQQAPVKATSPAQS